MAERYRDIVSPALVDVAARSTSGGQAQAARALEESLTSFSRFSRDLGDTFAAQAGERAGAKAGAEGSPEFQRGLASLGAYGQAYNDAALRSYAIKVEGDLNETAAELEAKAGTDPDAFAEAMDEVRKGILEEAPVEAQGALETIINQRQSAGLTRINYALAQEIRAEDQALFAEQAERLTDSIAYLRSQDTEEAQELALLEESKLQMLIDGAVGDGTISEVQGQVAVRQTETKIVQQTVMSRFRDELASPYGDPIGFLEDLKEAHRTNNTLSSEQEQNLENMLFAELRERNALRSARRSEMDALEGARMIEGERRATAMMLDGSLNSRTLYEMVVNQELEPSVARTLNNTLQAGDPGTSDPQTLFHVGTNVLSYTEEEIASNTSLTWADRARLIEQRRDDASSWKSTQEGKEAFARIDRALGVTPGTDLRMLSEEERQARDVALTELYETIDALPEEERLRAGVMRAAADKVVQTRIRETAISQLEELRKTHEYLLSQDVDSMGKTERERHERRLQTTVNEIARLESQARGGASE